jgi:hypothetical protein
MARHAAEMSILDTACTTMATRGVFVNAPHATEMSTFPPPLRRVVGLYPAKNFIPGYRGAGMPCQHLYFLGSYGSLLAGGVDTHQLHFQAPVDDFGYLVFTQPTTLYLGTGGLACPTQPFIEHLDC